MKHGSKAAVRATSADMTRWIGEARCGHPMTSMRLLRRQPPPVRAPSEDVTPGLVYGARHVPGVRFSFTCLRSGCAQSCVACMHVCWQECTTQQEANQHSVPATSKPHNPFEFSPPHCRIVCVRAAQQGPGAPAVGASPARHPCTTRAIPVCAGQQPASKPVRSSWGSALVCAHVSAARWLKEPGSP